jgi:hypothetical protein
MAVAFLFGAKVVLFRANSNTTAAKAVKVRLAVGMGVTFGSLDFGSRAERSIALEAGQSEAGDGCPPPACCLLLYYP